MWNSADIAFALIHYRIRWIVPMLLITAAAVSYAALKPSSWEATQAIVLRDEAISSLGRPGEFDKSEDMKQAQETVLQLTRSKEVIAAALRHLGPPEEGWLGSLWPAPSEWPTKDDIASARKKISVHSPGGTEFGTTEMLYVSVEAETPSRAKQLNHLICTELNRQLSEMRNSRAQSLVAELAYREQQASLALSTVTGELSEMESDVGTDLAELRLLNEVGSGNGNLREQMVQIKSELRQALDKEQSSKQLLEILVAAQENPSELIATPNQLLDSQPALRRLKDGLIDAQLRSAALQGIRTETHPSVVVARQAEAEVREHLNQEVALAIRGLEADRTVNHSRIVQLRSLLDEVSGRMTKLASLRARYNNLIREVQDRNEKLTKIRTDLADARSTVAASTTTSLVTEVSDTEVSDYPVGPSRKMIAGAGLIGGLMLGLGVLFLTVSPAPHSPTTSSPELSSRPAATDPDETNGHGQTPLPHPAHGLSLKEALNQLAQRTPSRN